MKTTTHAPAPWKYHLNVGPTKALIVEADGSTIAEIRNNVHDSRFEANVRVMTAAPQLLVVAKMFEVRGQGLTPYEWSQVRAAIVKASGAEPVMADPSNYGEPGADDESDRPMPWPKFTGRSI